MIELSPAQALAIADALEGTSGNHDAAIMSRYGMTDVKDLRWIAFDHGVYWCAGCTRYVSNAETCKRKRKGCPLL